MHFLSPTLFALVLALVQTSYAAPSSRGFVSKRTVYNLPASDEFIICGSRFYALPEIEAAVQEGINRARDTALRIRISTFPTLGFLDLANLLLMLSENYPHPYGNSEAFRLESECIGRQLWEYPIRPSRLFSESDVMAEVLDRVFFAIRGENPATNTAGDGTYCGVMTHEGSMVRNGFVLCEEEDSDDLEDVLEENEEDSDDD
ncbi:hypothetical protein S7711_11352 [Stachybotrys chartarum IBT 7711]|jgi:hypothetical protein|uniref:Uncharacterized protein n=1 Tax=Stachybotrys chartarum (strain CBS 109288 / IBT 7711) TaxID=1280523 RepID=A0A084ASB0_STACB|nr:hypothetical protein S7711_11352 [Stachybotrys chartarum IBT 7711]KFA51441.1 hypothetical protein S40293_10686 [Stachybotrys chartarum IBT 40293]KFA72003.1 hypothetical protein S40288_11345 [Stachybotrys chartarum IBT 40288]